MEFIDSLRNLFFDPREFARDKLVESYSWWKYLIILFFLQLLSQLPAALMLGLSFTESFGVGYLVSMPVISLVMIFLLNAPFRKDVTTSEYLSVNLAAFCYGAFVSFIFAFLSSLLLVVSPVLVFINTLFMIVISILLIIAYIKIVSELHDVSPWKVFGLWVVYVLIVGLISVFAAFSVFISVFNA